MGLNKTRGNMYSWCTHTHSHLAGACPHQCVYCYVKSGRAAAKYAGPLHLVEKELEVSYGGKAKTIFIEHCNDLFAEGVPTYWIMKVLAHCRKYPLNTYVFQTKNPSRAWIYWRGEFPTHSMLGVTIETNRRYEPFVSLAPEPPDRFLGLFGSWWADWFVKLFITIEPIFDCDPIAFAEAIANAEPAFVNIGADSKGHNLPEPSWDKVQELIAQLTRRGIEIREKHNLERLREA